MNKGKSLILAFVLGGSMGAIAQLFMLLFSKIGLGSALVILIFSMAGTVVVTVVLYLLKLYQKWGKYAEMGAMIPVSGLFAGVADGVVEGRKRGLSMGKAVIAGVAPITKLLLVGLICAFIIALTGFILT